MSSHALVAQEMDCLPVIIGQFPLRLSWDWWHQKWYKAKTVEMLE